MRKLPAVLLLVACGKSAAPSAPSPSVASPSKPAALAPEKITKALDGSWEDGVAYKLAGGGGFSAIVTAEGLQVVFDRAPKGTRYKIGDQAGVVDDGTAVVTVPFPVDLAR